MRSPRSHRADPLTLASPLSCLRGLGPKRSEAWRASGVQTIALLLRWPPRRHVRFPAPIPLAKLEEGVAASIDVVVVRRKGSGRRGVVVTRLDVRESTSASSPPPREITAILFGPRWLASAFARNERLLLRGELRARGEAREFLVRGWLHEEELPPASAPIAAELFQPHYSLPEGIAPRLHRRLLRATLAALAPSLERIHPPFAEAVCERPHSLHALLAALHFPRDEAEQKLARRAFALEAAIAIQRRLAAARRSRAPRMTPACADAATWLRDYLGAWPFTLTGDQRQALEEIAQDLSSPHVMRRLLSGDVGSGKSAVAFFPLYAAARAGRQAALLAPTEILARQHQATLMDLLARLGLPPPRLLAAGEKPARGAAPPAPIGEAIVVGTHRLLSAPVRFRDLASVVIDEQHKFGVRQRATLFAKGERPDLLLVSATPIPRTLAHTLFGHLDLSLLAQRPFALRNVRTELLVGAARREVGLRIRAELERGGKAFVVCPAIAAESPSAIAAERVLPWLERELGSAHHVALLHGRQSSEEKQQRLAQFTRGEVCALVATVVVEVGIDVPDATLVVVLGADRFGLSQLHQIRGRVGRRGHPASCLLVAAAPADEARERLDAFTRIDDGFELAELDFSLRGPGELLGLRQHGLAGALYPEALLDPKLVALARQLARREPASLEEDARNSSCSKPFGEAPVASSPAIW